MKGKVLFGLFALSLGVLFTALLGSSSASAASVYDDVYRTTDTLRLKDTGRGYDITINERWSELLLNDLYDDIPIEFTNSGGQSTISPQGMRDSFMSALLDGGRWHVSEFSSEDDSTTHIYISWSEDDSLTAEWTEDYVRTINYDYRIMISFTGNPPFSSYRIQVRIQNTSGYYISSSPSYPNNIRNFIAYLNPNYPADYEGEEFQETYTPPATYKPDFDYNVSIDGNLSVYYLETLPLILKGTWNWQVVKTGDNWEMPLELVDEGTSSPADLGQWFVELPSAGFYHVGIGYTGSPNDTPNITISGVAIQFEWNGTGIISGSTLGCYGEDNVCNETLNSQSPFYRLLTSINVPTYGLTDALTAPINFVGTFPSLAGVCSPIQLPLPAYIGNTDDIELPCLTPIYQSYAPSFLTLWQVALTALVSYAVVNKVFAKLRETYNPRQDRIEPTNL